jgi:tetratricopeptide (TPR) repeat protein
MGPVVWSVDERSDDRGTSVVARDDSPVASSDAPKPPSASPPATPKTATADAATSATAKPAFSKAVHRELEAIAALTQQGKWDEGRRRFDALLAADPENPLLLNEAGRFELAAKNFARATELFGDAYVKSGESRHLEAFNGMVLALREQKNFDGAVDKLSELSRQFPAREEVTLALADAYLEGKRPEEVVRLVEEYRASGGKADPQVEDRLAAAYRTRGEFEKALEHAESAHELVARKVEEEKRAGRDTRRFEQDLAYSKVARAMDLAHGGDAAQAKAVLEEVRPTMKPDEYARLERSVLQAASRSQTQ